MQKVIFKNERGQTITLGNSRPFILTKIGGLGGVNTNLITSKSPYQDGTSHHNTLLEPRIIPIEGGIMGRNREDVYRKREELSSVFNSKVKGTLTYINDALERKIDCIVEVGPTWGEGVRRMQKFLIQLYAPNPFLMDRLVIDEEIAQWLGGMTFPLRLPTRFATKGEPRALIINKGDVSTPLDITIIGPATNPIIRNRSTGEFIRVKRVLEPSDRLYISTEFGRKRVFIRDNEGVETNVLNWIDLDSTFINLEVGDNAIEYTSDDDVFKARVFIKYKNRYVGV